MQSNKLGEYLKRIRREQQMTLARLSERIGYSDAYISMVENGIKKKPSFEFLTEIAKGLNVEYYYLLYLASYIELDQFDQYMLDDSSNRLEVVHEVIRKTENQKNLEERDEQSKNLKNKLEQIFTQNGHEISESKLPYGSEQVSYDNLPNNLYNLLKTGYDLFYKEKELTEKNKQDIAKFIETFIIDKGE